MGVLDILVDSLDYPLRDWKKYLILGIFLFIMRYVETFASIRPISLLVMFIVLILEIVIFGYICSVIASAIRHKKDIPSFSFVENIVDGLKYLVLGIVYTIIPFVLFYIMLISSGSNSAIIQLLQASNPYFTVLGFPTGDLFSGFINGITQSSYTMTFIILFILGLIFSFFFVMSLSRMVDTESLKEALNFRAVLKTMKTIGWGTYITWFIVISLYLIMFGCIRILLGLIPYVGLLVACLVIFPYTILFASRAIGLVYKQTKYVGALNSDIDPNDELNQMSILKEKEVLRQKNLKESAEKQDSAIKQTQNLRKQGINYSQDKNVNVKKPIGKVIHPKPKGEVVYPESKGTIISSDVENDDVSEDEIKPEGKVLINPIDGSELLIKEPIKGSIGPVKDDVKIDESSIKKEFITVDDKELSSKKAKEDAFKEIQNLISDEDSNPEDIIAKLQKSEEDKKKD